MKSCLFISFSIFLMSCAPAKSTASNLDSNLKFAENQKIEESINSPIKNDSSMDKYNLKEKQLMEISKAYFSLLGFSRLSNTLPCRLYSKGEYSFWINVLRKFQENNNIDLKFLKQLGSINAVFKKELDLFYLGACVDIE